MGPDGNGVWRAGRFFGRASGPRRWSGRILDALFAAILTAAALGIANAVDGDLALTGFVAYPASFLFLGALYGCTCSPGQAIAGVVSLRSSSGRRVGFWRGMLRYLFVGLLPISVIMLIWAALDGGGSVPGGEEAIRVYRRRPAPGAPQPSGFGR